MAAPGDDPAVAASHRALCVVVDSLLARLVEHPVAAGYPGAIWGGEEERDSSDRPRQPAPRCGDGAGQRDRRCEPRPAAPYPDDHDRLCGRHGPTGDLLGSGIWD